jgi:hypothetical protein
LSFLFFKLLHWYSIFDIDTRQTGSNNEFIKEFNVSIYKYLLKIEEFNMKSYEKVKRINKKYKESDKQKIIKDFEMMKKEVREVEDAKKNLGIGKWAYGKGTDFFKYKKETYLSEDIRSQEVKTMMSALYSKIEMENETGRSSNPFTDVNNLEQTNDEMVYLEEQDPLTTYDNDDVLNEYGEVLEDYDN